jgi:hypothetical protein
MIELVAAQADCWTINTHSKVKTQLNSFGRLLFSVLIIFML